jgi:prepilin-type N-terminal cleavage/methylation domain-containing protein
MKHEGSRHGDQTPVRRRSGAGPALRAFTLVEMLVSLAVLALALSVVGVVFTVTTRTASQAAAYSEAQNWLRECLYQIEEDLKYCDPTNSVLVIVGRRQPAALTQDDLVAGKYIRFLVGDSTRIPSNFDPNFTNLGGDVDPEKYQYSDPRADILMFYTQRPCPSQAPPRKPKSGSMGQAYADGAKVAPVQVVYGHAAIAEPLWNDSLARFEFPDETSARIRHIEQTIADGTARSNLPANQWHLSRRATIVEYPPDKLGNALKRISFGADKGDEDEWRRVTRCQPSDLYAGDVVWLDVPAFLERFGPNPPKPDPVPLLRPYDFPNPTKNRRQSWDAIERGEEPRDFKWDKDTVRAVYSQLYFQGDDGKTENHHVATVIENPPVELQSNLGVHMLPGCVWFQVELLMPEDPRNSLDYDAPLDTAGGNENKRIAGFSTRLDMPRWTAVELGKTYVFPPDTAPNRELVSSAVKPKNSSNDSGGGPYETIRGSRLQEFALVIPQSGDTDEDLKGVGNRRVRMWPYAIRITVRAVDPRGRLPEPIVRTLVHRFE